jgi:hypothetical protein
MATRRTIFLFSALTIGRRTEAELIIGIDIFIIDLRNRRRLVAAIELESLPA